MKNTIFLGAILLVASTSFSQTYDTTIVDGETIIIFTANSPADKLFRLGDVDGL